MMNMGRILDAICDAIEASGKTRYRIAKDSDISQAQLWRLMSGERGLSIDALERLADFASVTTRNWPLPGTAAGPIFFPPHRLLRSWRLPELRSESYSSNPNCGAGSGKTHVDCINTCTS